jgi:hypothetical protein
MPAGCLTLIPELPGTGGTHPAVLIPRKADLACRVPYRHLDDTGALIAEHQRRLGSRMSTRQDRVIERRDAGGHNADQDLALRRLRLGQLDLLQPAVIGERLCFNRTHRYSPASCAYWVSSHFRTFETVSS